MSTFSSTDSMVILGEWHVRYNYSVGKVAGHFFEALKNRKILATRCSKSGIAYLPPRAYCERSFEPCDEWVEAGQEGVIEAATVVTVQFEGLRAPPYAIAYVRLDGVSTALCNFVEGGLDGRPGCREPPEAWHSRSRRIHRKPAGTAHRFSLRAAS